MKRALAAALAISLVIMPAFTAQASLFRRMVSVLDIIDEFFSYELESPEWGNEPEYEDPGFDDPFGDPDFDIDSLDPAYLESYRPTPVNVPDSALSFALLELCEPGTFMLTVGDMLDLPESLNLSSKGISDLSGLKYASRVKSLNISGNNIADLGELSSLNRLESLDYSNNKVERAPSFLFSMESLVELNGAENGTKNLIAYNGTNKLRTIDLHGNELESVANLESCPMLEMLNLSGNKLASVPTGLTKLREVSFLDLSNNMIGSVPSLSNLSKLISINLDGNKLTEVPLSFSPSMPLTTLKLSNNSITSIPEGLADYSSLEFLYLNVNCIEELPSFLANMPKLRVLQVSLNNIDLSESSAIISQLSNKLDSLSYRLQAQPLTLSISRDKSSGKPIISWPSIQTQNVDGEGSLSLASLTIERRGESPGEDGNSIEISELVNEYTVLGSPNSASFIDNTAEDGVEYTYRVTALMSGIYGNQTMDDSQIEVEKSSVGRISTRDIGKAATSYKKIIIASLSAVAIAAFALAAFLLFTRRVALPATKIQRKAATVGTHTTKLDTKKATEAPSAKRKFGEKPKEAVESVSKAIDSEEVDYTKIYR
ncbi:MAG: leucine-rich repeat domain-containing protein [Eubacteriaceae bacterium]|nr:leucine-rich repeat domain-containing protein [Eubacteriaceae bacterium]